MATLKLCLERGGKTDMRRVRVDSAGMSFTSLESLIATTFRLEPHTATTVRYVDDEGDNIRITSDDDLAEAFRVTAIGRGAALRLTVNVPDDDVNPAAVDAAAAPETKAAPKDCTFCGDPIKDVSHGSFCSRDCSVTAEAFAAAVPERTDDVDDGEFIQRPHSVPTLPSSVGQSLLDSDLSHSFGGDGLHAPPGLVDPMGLTAHAPAYFPPFPQQASSMPPPMSHMRQSLPLPSPHMQHSMYGSAQQFMAPVGLLGHPHGHGGASGHSHGHGHGHPGMSFSAPSASSMMMMYGQAPPHSDMGPTASLPASAAAPAPHGSMPPPLHSGQATALNDPTALTALSNLADMNPPARTPSLSSMSTSSLSVTRTSSFVADPGCTETPLNEPSLCVPWVSPEVSRDLVGATFGQFGAVRQVDLVPREDHYLCFVHFDSWKVDDPEVAALRQRLLNPPSLEYKESVNYVHPVSGPQRWLFSCSRVPPRTAQSRFSDSSSRRTTPGPPPVASPTKLPPHEPSVCVPWVRQNVTEELLRSTFDALGTVRQVDLVPKGDHFLCFVHFEAWHMDDPKAVAVRARLLKPPTPDHKETIYNMHPKFGRQRWLFARSWVTSSRSNRSSSTDGVSAPAPEVRPTRSAPTTPVRSRPSVSRWSKGTRSASRSGARHKSKTEAMRNGSDDNPLSPRSFNLFGSDRDMSVF